jgi:hypothetical protein
MTRAGEKLYGDWEARAGRDTHLPWRQWLATAALAVLAAALAWVALFGFAY